MVKDEIMRYVRLNFSIVLAISMVVSFLPIYLDYLGYSFTEIGYLYSFFPLTIILALPLIGHLADIVGKKLVLIIAILSEIIAVSLYLIDQSFIFIILARILDGVAASTLALILLAKIEDKITEDRGKNTGIFLSARSLATLISPLVVFVMADYLFLKSPLVLSLIILAVSLACIFSYKRLHFRRVTISDMDYLANIRKFLSYPGLFAMFLLGFSKHAANLAIQIYLPLYLLKEFNYSLTLVGVMVFIFRFPALFQFMVGRYTDSKGSRNPIVFGVLIGVMGFLGLAFSANIALIALSLLVLGAGDAIWNTSAWHYMSEIGERNRIEGLVVTSYMGLAKIGALVSTFISGLLYESYSYMALLLVHAASLLFFAGLSTIFFRKQEIEK